jgi:peptidoglycan hydrolase-like protein with peptidoglycan-binding domain
MMERGERMAGMVEESPVTTDATPPRRGLRWWWLGVVVAVGAATAGGIALFSGGDGDTVTTEAASLAVADVVRTDLVQMDSFDGTLGSEAGDPVPSQMSGTVTATADVGTMVGQGDVFLTVDNEPVVLLYGSHPAYRDLRATEDTLALVGNRSGVVTGVVAAGDTVQQGDVLYRVNGDPVVVMYGDVPAYRTLRDLSDNMVGDDVLQLETALVALGYDPDGLASVDDEFTSYTATMVERWQEDLGVEADGVVELGDVIFIPERADVLSVAIDVGQSVGAGQQVATVTAGDPLQGEDVRQLEAALLGLGYQGPVADGVWDDGTSDAVLAWQEAAGMEPDGVVNLGEVVFLPATVRVNDVLASVGSSVAAGTPVLDISSAEKTVSFDLPARDQGLLTVGQAVNIQMPDGSDTPGTVSSIASVATAQQGADAVFAIEVTLDDPSVGVGLDEAPVDVEVISDSVHDVMAVPVSALLALAEGGYAVEVDGGDGTTHLVAVDPGFYADGMVEVTSGGLEVGDRVVVP